MKIPVNYSHLKLLKLNETFNGIKDDLVFITSNRYYYSLNKYGSLAFNHINFQVFLRQIHTFKYMVYIKKYVNTCLEVEVNSSI